MPQLVHVIRHEGPPPGRWQHTFPDKAKPAEILAALAANRGLYGYNKTVKKADPAFGLKEKIEFGDPTSGFAWDHPNTVVAIGHEDDAGDFVVDKILKGTFPVPEDSAPSAVPA